MSIIQEALKKIEGSGGSRKESGETKRAEKGPETKQAEKPVFTQAIKKPVVDKRYTGPKYIYYIITAALLSILAGIVVKISYSPPAVVSPEAAVPAPVMKAETILPKIERRYEPVAASAKKGGAENFVLNGIMYLVDGPRALINDIMVGEGETVSGAKVVKIKKDGVILNYNNSEVDLSINE